MQGRYQHLNYDKKTGEKMLKAQLMEREREELRRIAKKEGDRRKERAVAVLMNDEGRR